MLLFQCRTIVLVQGTDERRLFFALKMVMVMVMVMAVRKGRNITGKIQCIQCVQRPRLVEGGAAAATWAKIAARMMMVKE